MIRTTNLSRKDAERFETILASLPDPVQETWEQSLVRRAVLELRESLESQTTAEQLEKER